MRAPRFAGRSCPSRARVGELSHRGCALAKRRAREVRAHWIFGEVVGDRVRDRHAGADERARFGAVDQSERRGDADGVGLDDDVLRRPFARGAHPEQRLDGVGASVGVDGAPDERDDAGPHRASAAMAVCPLASAQAIWSASRLASVGARGAMAVAVVVARGRVGRMAVLSGLRA